VAATRRDASASARRNLGIPPPLPLAPPAPCRPRSGLLLLLLSSLSPPGFVALHKKSTQAGGGHPPKAPYGRRPPRRLGFGALSLVSRSGPLARLRPGQSPSAPVSRGNPTNPPKAGGCAPQTALIFHPSQPPPARPLVFHVQQSPRSHTT